MSPTKKEEIVGKGTKGSKIAKKGEKQSRSQICNGKAESCHRNKIEAVR
jgi:hypothetical protein